jgi:WD40 repeat protein
MPFDSLENVRTVFVPVVKLELHVQLQQPLPHQNALQLNEVFRQTLDYCRPVPLARVLRQFERNLVSHLAVVSRVEPFIRTSVDESAFTALNFSPDGKMLAAVGTFSDETLTVWNWEKANLILGRQAFLHDIYRATFSDKLAGRLTAGGVGHIRF